MSNAVKNFEHSNNQFELTSFQVLHHFDSLKLFSDLYLAKFLDTFAKRCSRAYTYIN